MIPMAADKGLLDTLWETVGCLYLSDLRLPDNHEKVRQAIRELRPEDYPPAEWQDAAHYLIP